MKMKLLTTVKLEKEDHWTAVVDPEIPALVFP
jgi:hypothetical protein